MNRKSFRRLSFLVVMLAFVGGCASGRPLYVPGDLARVRGAQAPPPSAAPPRVAVLDFTFREPPGKEVGRDYDNVRPIVWKGDRGAGMADLVAAVLVEKGVPVVRVRDAAGVPPGVERKVWGRVDEFRVNAKRERSVKVESAARVALTLFASGPSVPEGWHSAVSSEFWGSDPVFITPEGVRDALLGAANGAAEEAGRRLSNAGIAVSLPAGGAGAPEREPSP